MRRDDHLGTLSISPYSPIGRAVRVVTNPVEGAVYVVGYVVAEVTDAQPVNPPF